MRRGEEMGWERRERGLEKKVGEVAAGGVERVYAEPVGRSVPLGCGGSMARRRVVAESQPSALQRQGPRASGPFASHLALRPRRIFLSRARFTAWLKS